MPSSVYSAEAALGVCPSVVYVILASGVAHDKCAVTSYMKVT
jgi:hypothetical protein